MSSSIEEFGKEILASVRDSVRNGCDERIDEALKYVRVEGIEITAAALYEAGVDDTVIINLLQKHWHTDIDNATEVLRKEKTVEFPSRALIAYLTGQGLDSRDRRHFMTKNKVREKLSHEPNLWKLTPAELIDAVKENE
jgi:hypothetical protein